MVLALYVEEVCDPRENVDWRRVWGLEVMLLIPWIFGST